MNPLGPLAALALTAALIMLLRPLALAVGLVDVPAGRKSHSGNIPLIGGLSIYLSALIAIWVVHTLQSPGFESGAQLVAFFAAGFVLIAVGAWDDYKDLPPVTRFVAQMMASLIMIFAGGVVLKDLGVLTLSGALLELGWLSVPFTVFACLGVINAMNMCDGLDGLSGSLALIALLGFGIANSLWGALGDQYLIAVFSACVAGFLIFNLRTFWRARAWVFLGDAGSMLLGITLTWIAIRLSQGEMRVMSPAAALWFLMLPIYDAVSMMLRRLLLRRSPFEADREHLHHIFLLAGFSVGETVTLMCGIAVGGVMVGLAAIWLAIPDVWVAAAFLAGGLLYYWGVIRAWRLMRFLRRSICRRTVEERREQDRHAKRRVNVPGSYLGIDRRSGEDRRAAS